MFAGLSSVFAGQLVSAVLWGISAAACTWYSRHLGAIILVLGGFLIFPLTQLLLRSMGHDYALPKGHPMNALGMQVAFILPLTLPVVIGIATLRPACAHVIPPSQLLGLSPATVQRKWSTARIWLYHQLSGPES
jgi:hypothetical protein